MKGMMMKKLFVLFVVVFISSFVVQQRAQAQDPITEVIRQGVIKVIKAVDLKIQRLQTKTIWLQNAQKVVENTMSKLKLEEIAGWQEKQRALYGDYFDELWKVKSAISYYHRVKEIINRQIQLVNEYKNTYARFKHDPHFTSEEVAYMARVYSGIIDESIKNIEQVALVINSFATQMSDAKRLAIINEAADGITENYNDLEAFNRENILISLQRAKDEKEIAVVKQLYGL